MGDQGGKKNREKGEKQSSVKQKQKSEDALDRQPRTKP
jgi:hypothetical protein